MDLYAFACEIETFCSEPSPVYFSIDPEVPDFTLLKPFIVRLFSNTHQLEFEVNPDNFLSIVGILDSTIFDKTRVDRLYVWNFKAFCSYFYFVSQRYLSPTNSIIDLKLIENFLNIRQASPKNLIEYVNRIKLAVKYKNWQSIYKQIHLPLALRVLPSMETYPLLNDQSKRSEYPYYEIEGQLNGRMNCLRKLSKSYLPHNMGPDVKAVLKPRGYGTRFMCSDFRHCEVTVLQWLSQDQVLKQVLDSGQDLHNSIYEIITGDKCNSDSKRNLSKKMFLPVMFGCGPNGLASNLSISPSVAADLINRIKTKFATSWDWMQQKQEQAKAGEIQDYFGRPRLFDQQESYLARNFSVQGVAATACQEKLIDLFAALNAMDEKSRAYLAFSVHDGFGMICQIKAAHETYKLVKNICETESKLCPGLKMKVEIKFGAKLDQMKVLWRD